jgi:osmotically inducible protein OsmC
MIRTANAVWNGGLKDGKGTFSTSSGAIRDLPYSFTTRFEQAPGTNPEELIAAALASCFSMALSAQLGEAGMAAKSIQTKADLSFEKGAEGWTVREIHLDVNADVPNANPADFEKVALNAKMTCPVSRTLNTKITMDAKLTTGAGAR